MKPTYLVLVAFALWAISTVFGHYKEAEAYSSYRSVSVSCWNWGDRKAAMCAIYYQDGSFKGLDEFHLKSDGWHLQPVMTGW